MLTRLLRYSIPLLLIGAGAFVIADDNLRHPDPVKNPQSAMMLKLPTSIPSIGDINFAKLPRVPSQHAVISDQRDKDGNRVNQHAYLAFHSDQYWAMWSDGPGISHGHNRVPGHDRAGQIISFATSPDGLDWTNPKPLTAPPAEGFGWIARGFWQREGKLLALATYYNAPGYSGPGLKLVAYEWTDDGWKKHGLVADDSMNNFPPKQLPTGEWMMSRRDSKRQVSMLLGGVKAFDDWRIQPVSEYKGLQKPEEPYWYVLPDGKSIVGLFRDNSKSKRLLRAFSADQGKTWSPLTRTNFPDAMSKFNVVHSARGYYFMVSNANPKGRDPLVLSVSRDGLVFTDLLYLVGGRHVDYPHVIEQGDHLFVAFSGVKQTVEVLKIALDDIEPLISRPANP